MKEEAGTLRANEQVRQLRAEAKKRTLRFVEQSERRRHVKVAANFIRRTLWCSVLDCLTDYDSGHRTRLKPDDHHAR